MPQISAGVSNVPGKRALPFGASQNGTPEMIQSFLLLVVAIFGLFLPVVAQHLTKDKQTTGNTQKTEQACLADWRAIKPASRAKGMTQQAFVQQCRSGIATAQASGGSAPSTNGTATPLQKPSPTAPHLAKRHAPERHARTHARSSEKQGNRSARAESAGGF